MFYFGAEEPSFFGWNPADKKHRAGAFFVAEKSAAKRFPSLLSTFSVRRTAYNGSEVRGCRR